MLESVTSALLKLATTVIEYAKSLHKMVVSSFETQTESSASYSNTVTAESQHETGDQMCDLNHTKNNSTFDLWVIVLTLSQVASNVSQITITIPGMIPGMIPGAIAVMIWIAVQVYYRTTVPRPARGSSQVSVTQPSHRPVEQLAQDLAGPLSRSAIALENPL